MSWIEHTHLDDLILCDCSGLRSNIPYEKLTAENVDLSSFNIVTDYDVPAIEKMDNTLRIQFCAS